MSSVPMPRDLSEEAVAMWLWDVSSIEGDLAWDDANSPSKEQAFAAARAVRALLREKVREAVVRTNADARDGKWIIADEVVSRVLGEEAPRG